MSNRRTFRIADAYLRAAEGRTAAVAALLQAPDYEEVLEASGYEQALARRAGRAFPSCSDQAT